MELARLFPTVPVRQDKAMHVSFPVNSTNRVNRCLLTSSESKTCTKKPAAQNGRIQANRANAKKSTRPKSELGKSRSRLNALKKGLFARSVLSMLPPSEKREYTKLF